MAASSWKLGSGAVQVAVQALVLAVLSRLMTPADFGIVGAAMVGVAFFRLFSDLGLSAALVQRSELSAAHVRAALTLSVLVGLLLTGVVYRSADFLARLLMSSEAAPVLRLLSLVVLATALTTVSNAVLWRNLRFKEIAIADIGGYAIGYGVVGTTLASLDLGPWALTWAILVQAFLRAALLYCFARHSLVPSFAVEPVRELMEYGAGLSMMRLCNFAATRGDYVVVSRWLGVESLGLYERAYRLMDLMAMHFAGVVDKVLFPAMAEIQSEEDRIGRAFLDSTTTVVLFYLPVAAFVGLSASDLVVVLFGSAWAEVAEPLRIFAVVLVFRASAKVCDSLIRAKAAVYRSAWRALLYAILVLVGAWTGAAWGIRGVATGVAVAIVLRQAMIADLSLQLLDVRWPDFFRRFLPGIWVAGMVAAPLSLFELLSHMYLEEPWRALPSLSVKILLSAVAVPIALMALPTSWAREDLRRIATIAARHLPLGSRLAAIINASD